MNPRLIVAIVATSVLTACSGGRSVGSDAPRTALAADVEGFAAEASC